MNYFKYILSGYIGYKNWFFILFRNAYKYLCFGDNPKNIKLYMHISDYKPIAVSPFILL